MGQPPKQIVLGNIDMNNFEIGWKNFKKQNKRNAENHCNDSDTLWSLCKQNYAHSF